MDYFCLSLSARPRSDAGNRILHRLYHSVNSSPNSLPTKKSLTWLSPSPPNSNATPSPTHRNLQSLYPGYGSNCCQSSGWRVRLLQNYSFIISDTLLSLKIALDVSAEAAVLEAALYGISLSAIKDQSHQGQRCRGTQHPSILLRCRLHRQIAHY